MILELGDETSTSRNFLASLTNEMASGAYPEFIRRMTIIIPGSKPDLFILDEHLTRDGHRAIAEEIMKPQIFK